MLEFKSVVDLYLKYKNDKSVRAWMFESLIVFHCCQWVDFKIKIPVLFQNRDSHALYLHLLKMLAPKTSDSTKSTKKIKNNTLAIEAAPAAIPPNPKIAATIAIIRNVTVQRNISVEFNGYFFIYN